MTATDSVEIQAEFGRPLHLIEAELHRSLVKHGRATLKARGKAEKDSKSISSQVHDALSKYFQKTAVEMRKLICDQLHYCDRIDTEPVKLAVDIADLIVGGAIALVLYVPIPAARISVYILRTRLLDNFCDCRVRTKL